MAKQKIRNIDELGHVYLHLSKNKELCFLDLEDVEQNFYAVKSTIDRTLY